MTPSPHESRWSFGGVLLNRWGHTNLYVGVCDANVWKYVSKARYCVSVFLLNGILLRLLRT